MIIAQISDMHLQQDGALAHGVVDTARTLADAVDRIGALDPPPDAVIATGDLVDNGSPEEYRRLRRLLAPLAQPVFLIPGNRDDRSALRAEFGRDGYLPEDGPFLQYVIDDYPVRLIALDTVMAGSKLGEMCSDRLRWLEARLGEAHGRPTVVFMHHPPFRTGVPFMDEQVFTGADALEDVIRRHASVERVLCGHLHRPIQRLWGGTLAAVAPSTAFHMPLDLHPNATMGVMLEPAAGLLHVWQPETGLITHLLPLARHPGPYPFKRRPPPT